MLLFFLPILRGNIKYKNSRYRYWRTRCGTRDGMAAKFRRIDEPRKNEPLIKDFLHSPLAFDVPSRARTSALSIRAFLESERVSRVPHVRSTSKEFSSLEVLPFDRPGSSSSLFSYTRRACRAPHIRVKGFTFATGRSFYS